MMEREKQERDVCETVVKGTERETRAETWIEGERLTYRVIGRDKGRER